MVISNSEKTSGSPVTSHPRYLARSTATRRGLSKPCHEDNSKSYIDHWQQQFILIAVVMMKAQQHQIFNEIESNDLYGMKRTIAAMPSALSMRRMPVRHTGLIDLGQMKLRMLIASNWSKVVHARVHTWA